MLVSMGLLKLVQSTVLLVEVAEKGGGGEEKEEGKEEKEEAEEREREGEREREREWKTKSTAHLQSQRILHETQEQRKEMPDQDVCQQCPGGIEGERNLSPSAHTTQTHCVW